MILDIIFCGIVLLFALHGLSTGLIRQTMAVARVVLSIVGAVLLSQKMIPVVSRMVENEHWRWVLAFAVVFFAIWIVCLFIEGVLVSSIKAIKMTGLDRMMGFVLGAICGSVLCIVITLILLSQPLFDVSGMFKDSYVGQFFAYYAQQIQAGSLKKIK
ncbi:MAG: CvpA family protein [Spirochaetia bacterium]